MNKKLLTGALLIMAISAKAQTADRQVLGASGGSFSGSTLSADFTLGQTATETKSAGSFLLTQGFQQPLITSTGVAEVAPSVAYSLYPNPARNMITLELSSQSAATLLLSLTGVNGQTVRPAEQLQLKGSAKKELSLEGLASGIYFLQLANKEGGLLQSIRFVKQ